MSLPDELVGGAPPPARPPAGPAPRRRAGGHSVVAGTGDAVKAPMQATIVKVAVAEGQQVVKGDLVVVLEAMKMEQPIQAHKDGVIGSSTPTPARPSRAVTSCSRSRTRDPDGAGGRCRGPDVADAEVPRR